MCVFGVSGPLPLPTTRHLGIHCLLYIYCLLYIHCQLYTHCLLCIHCSLWHPPYIVAFTAIVASTPHIVASTVYCGIHHTLWLPPYIVASTVYCGIRILWHSVYC